MRSWIEARGRRHDLRDATLLLGVDEAGGGAATSFDVYAESRGGDAPGGAGVSLNGIPARGVRGVEDLAGKEVIFPPPVLIGIGKVPAALPAEDDDDDGERSGGEQVWYVPGTLLEVETVRVKFGAVAGGTIEVDLEGRFTAMADETAEVVGEGVEAKAHLVARVEVAAAGEPLHEP